MTPVSGAHKFLGQCHDCRFTLLANCGHWVMLEHQQFFNDTLAQILSHGSG
jgi:4,5:9,10-diseco-3-hydroxy-5,9,17-trioxoandrosta-1(10),2-diene-4-oate hydrolase